MKEWGMRIAKTPITTQTPLRSYSPGGIQGGVNAQSGVFVERTSALLYHFQVPGADVPVVDELVVCPAVCTGVVGLHTSGSTGSGAL